MLISEDRQVGDTPTCLLCKSAGAADYCQDRRRLFYQCARCELVFVHPEQFLPPQAEKAEYDLHQNEPNDSGYRRFLSRTFLPMNARIAPCSSGLDFGCGPGPTLSLMFEEAGHRVAIYDPLYANDPALLDQTYDFITATEVVEHLHRPADDLSRLWRCLKPGGLLGIMTKLVIDRQAFERWHYKNDLTHVCFYSAATFSWLARQWNARLDFVDKDVVILTKRRSSKKIYQPI